MITKKYKVLVVEDEPIILKDIIFEIEGTNLGFYVIGHAFNGADAIKLVESLNPDVIFTDIRMPIMDGLELISKVRLNRPDIQIVILSGYSDFEYAKQAIRLGVHDYLLKPLDTQPLLELLASLAKAIDQLTLTENQMILTSAINGMNDNSSMPPFYTECKFCLYLVCIGNLCNNINASSQHSFYHSLWQKASLPSLVDNFSEDSNSNWWIVDEKIPNQKFIIVSTSPESHHNHPDFACKLVDSISKLLSPYPVNICYEKKIVPYTEMHTQSAKLRRHLERKLIIGDSNAICYNDTQSELITPLLDTTRITSITTCLKTNNMSSLKKELFDLLSECEYQKVSQKIVEKYLLQILYLINEYTTSDDTINVMDIEYLIGLKLASCLSLSSIQEDLWSSYESLFQQNYTATGYMDELALNVAEYMNLHFTKDLSIEDLSAKFSFNGTYLTRVFKRFIGQTPVKYLISLRINEAKRLMEEYPTMDIKEISEMVGYSDAHYFSRLFKNNTGISPTEFKDSIKI